MSKLIWDNIGERIYETGVQNGVFYPRDNDGNYPKGVVWNGLTTVTESPSGAEANPIYADNIKYLNLMSAEEFGATIEAITFPEEFALCDGSAELGKGVYIGQQTRKSFGFVYKTIVGDDVLGNELGYKLHIVYNATASPSDKAYATINESPDAVAFSWEITTIPIPIPGHKPSATVIIDSTKTEPAKLKEIEDILFGADAGPGGTPAAKVARLPLPVEIAAIFAQG